MPALSIGEQFSASLRLSEVWLIHKLKCLLDKWHYLPQINSASPLLISLSVQLINSCLWKEWANNEYWKFVSEGRSHSSVAEFSFWSWVITQQKLGLGFDMWTINLVATSYSLWIFCSIFARVLELQHPLASRQSF